MSITATVRPPQEEIYSKSRYIRILQSTWRICVFFRHLVSRFGEGFAFMHAATEGVRPAIGYMTARRNACTRADNGLIANFCVGEIWDEVIAG